MRDAIALASVVVLANVVFGTVTTPIGVVIGATLATGWTVAFLQSPDMAVVCEQPPEDTNAQA